jgi:YidC/Oxa1 family membrane protein insertase
MLSQRERWRDEIEHIRSGFVFNLGQGGQAAGAYLLKAVLKKQQAREAAASASKVAPCATPNTGTDGGGDRHAA